MLSEREVESKLKEVIAKIYKVKPEDLKPETRFIDDLGADSITTIELIAEIEDAFGIEIPDEAVERNQTVGQAVEYVIERLREEGRIR